MWFPKGVSASVKSTRAARAFVGRLVQVILEDKLNARSAALICPSRLGICSSVDGAVTSARQDSR